MSWIIGYVIGMVAMAVLFAYMDAKYGNPDTSRQNSHGRMVAIVLWPLVAPFVIYLWISSRSA